MHKFCQIFRYITEYRDYTDISQLPPHRLLEIRRYNKLLLKSVCMLRWNYTAYVCRFFEDYKKNEKKEVKIDDFLNAEEAKKAIKQSMVSSKCCLQCPSTFHTVGKQ